VRRQTHDVGLATRWVASPLDVDPCQLPAKFALPLRGRTGRSSVGRDTVLVSCDCVALERDGRIEAHEIDDFLGVSVRIDGGDDFWAVSINLHHDDPDLCIPLHVAFDMDEVGARWQSWAQRLGLPLLLPGEDGTWREAVKRLGKVAVKNPHKRRGGVSSERRSRTSATRKTGEIGELRVLKGEEIIARR